MRITQPTLTKTNIIFITAIALLLAAIVFFIPHVQAEPSSGSNERLISIHDRGVEKGIITSARTLREAFKEADILLDKNDIVEPGLDEELIANNYQVNVYRARPVVIVDGATKQLVMTAYQTPKQIAEHVGITLHDEDRATIELTNDIISDGASVKMVIERAAAIKLTLYGKEETVYTQAATVAEFLEEKGITLEEKDTLSVPATKPIVDGMSIEVWRNGKQTVTREEEIKPPVKQIQDVDREIGYRKVTKVGTPGKKMVTYEIVIKNGKEVSKKVLQTVVVTKPTQQVEIVGAKPSFSGDFAAALAKLRACEAGGNYANKNNPLYRGAYQFSYQTWANKYGIYDPADATAAQQDQAARELYLRRGWQPWPHCGASLPDTYR